MVSLKWIDEKMRFLTSQIGIYRLDAGNDFFFEPSGGFYGFISQGQVAALNEAMGMLATHISSITCPIIEDWEGSTDFLTTIDYDFSSNNEISGVIFYDGPNRSRIRIGFLNKHSPFIMGAILAHELTHHFLFNKGILDPDINENERLTDLATVYLGLGKLTLNGYEPFVWNINRNGKQIKYTYKVGYLLQEDMAAIMKQICDFRQIPFGIVKNNLTDKAYKLIIRSYFDLIQDKQINIFKKLINKIIIKSKNDKNEREFIKPKKSYEVSIIIECIKCGKKLRVPIPDYMFRINCPACGNKFILRNK